MRSGSSEPSKVAIIGGGVAALEAMIALDAMSYAGVDVHLFSPQPRFVLKPLAVSSGFGRGELLSFDLDKLAATARATFHNAAVEEVDPGERVLRIAEDGPEGESQFAYDFLIAAQGTQPVESVPGATTYRWSAGNEILERELAPLRDLEAPKVIVTLPEQGSWPLPTYELALMIASDLGPGASITVVTPETAPLEMFGKGDAEKVAAVLAKQGVDLITGVAPSEFSDGALGTSDGRRIDADMVIALPLLTGRRIPGLPTDGSGFIPVDDFGRIEGLAREFAAGDVTSFPVKFGGLAAEQADIVAASIGKEARGGPAPAPFRPVYRGVMVTAEGAIGLGPGVDNSDPYGWNPAEKIYGRYLSPVLKAADPATTSD
jgi:sulfide:quinone oxidoreductase